MTQGKRQNQPVQPTQTRSRRPWWAVVLVIAGVVALAGVVAYQFVPGGAGSPVSSGSTPHIRPASASPRAGTDAPPSTPVRGSEPENPRRMVAELAADPSVKPAKVREATAPAPNGATIEIGIAYGTEKRSWFEWAVREFGETAEGKGIRINLIPTGSLESAHAIVEGDQRIHVWSPASSHYRDTFLRDWTRQRRGNPIAKAEEMLALTPMVFVMWKSRYEAFTAKSPEVSLRTIGYAMRAKTGWRRIADKPEWGLFKFGHTQPTQSNSGLMTLILLAYEYHKKRSGLTVDDAIAPDFQAYLARFERGVTGLSNSTGNLMTEMLFKGPASFDALMVYESVAIDYLKTAQGRWEELRIVYPQYNLWNENPYYILNTPWTTPAHQRAAEQFLKYLMSAPVQARALEHGFRPGNPDVPLKGPESPFVVYANNGLSIELPSVCQTPSPEVLESLQQTWIRNAVPR